MVKVKFAEVMVRMDISTTVPKVVMLQEIPILEEVYGELPNVTKLEDVREVDAADEYKRLEKQYGSNEDGESFVRLAFGRFNTGGFEGFLKKNAPKAAKK